MKLKGYNLHTYIKTTQNTNQMQHTGKESTTSYNAIIIINTVFTD